MAAAHDGEVLITDAVLQATSAVEVPLEDRGRHSLKGVPGEHQLFAVTAAPTVR